MSSTSGGSENLRTLHVVFGPEQTRRAYWKARNLNHRDVLHWLKAAEELRGVRANIVLVDTRFQPTASQWQEWERVAHVAHMIVETTAGATLERGQFA